MLWIPWYSIQTWLIRILFCFVFFALNIADKNEYITVSLIYKLNYIYYNIKITLEVYVDISQLMQLHFLPPFTSWLTVLAACQPRITKSIQWSSPHGKLPPCTFFFFNEPLGLAAKAGKLKMVSNFLLWYD